MPDEAPRPDRAIPRWLDVAAGWSWRLLVVAAGLFALVWLLAKVKLVVIAGLAALLLATVLVPVKRWLGQRGIGPLIATWITFVVFLGLFVAVVAAVAPAVIDEFDDLDATLDDAGDEIEDWLVTGPLNLDEETVADWREKLVDTAGDLVSSDGAVTSGALFVGEAVTGVVITLVMTFFLVKDNEKIRSWVLAEAPGRFHPRLKAVGSSAWTTLGGYLRGAALLGFVEGVIIGSTLALVGAHLAVPVATITFFAAFIPFVGALVSGVLAAMVALVSGGVSAAVVVGIVALVVQQFDNDLLGPLIFGKALSIHPLVIVVAVTAGASLGGLTGAFLSVPLTALVINATGVLRDLEPPAVDLREDDVSR